MTIAVRVTPRGGRDALGAGGEGAGHFAARLSAPPVDGAANTALVALVAKAFGVPRRDVSIEAGTTARLKRLHLSGDPQVLAGIAARLYAEAP
ncbi:hypothetical protein SAMN05192583_1513 [Sphingomonas gellani]|uniref:UPF0235 protein SAMN05192583_1513 n=1 Tax=Sphingomonas gellani TaxID=1166340 RepID=A0A1H8C945_9SPHN|nr:DUF167 domain-containing protein [Sphingomonas gellani]SEM91731.1 hypothetical protein SAMN05192583_1513 [Sphingomonas gellani]